MGDNIVVAVIPPNLLELVWPQCVPFLERVIEKSPNDLSLKTIKDSLMINKSLLVTITEGCDVIAVCTFEINTYDTGHKVMYIPIVCGDRMDDWLEQVLDVAHLIAADAGCDELRGLARTGWIRKLKKHGWETLHTVIRCDIKQYEKTGD